MYRIFIKFVLFCKILVEFYTVLSGYINTFWNKIWHPVIYLTMELFKRIVLFNSPIIVLSQLAKLHEWPRFWFCDKGTAAGTLAAFGLTCHWMTNVSGYMISEDKKQRSQVNPAGCMNSTAGERREAWGQFWVAGMCLFCSSWCVRGSWRVRRKPCWSSPRS